MTPVLTRFLLPEPSSDPNPIPDPIPLQIPAPLQIPFPVPHHACRMASAVRVSLPSCRLMFLAAATTSSTVWNRPRSHSCTASSPYCSTPTCARGQGHHPGNGGITSGTTAVPWGQRHHCRDGWHHCGDDHYGGDIGTETPISCWGLWHQPRDVVSIPGLTLAQGHHAGDNGITPEAASPWGQEHCPKDNGINPRPWDPVKALRTLFGLWGPHHSPGDPPGSPGSARAQ